MQDGDPCVNALRNLQPADSPDTCGLGEVAYSSMLKPSSPPLA